MVIKGNKPMLLSLLVLGGIGGWFASQIGGPVDERVLIKPSKEIEKADLSFQAVESVPQARRGEVKKLQADIDTNTETSLAKVNEVEAELLALVFENPEDVTLTAERIMDYFNLIWRDGDRGVLAERKIRRFISSNPELNYSLLDRLFGVDNEQVKLRLETLLSINNSTQRPFLEPNVMSRVKLNEDRSEWLRILGDWGLQSKSNIAFLLNEMPYFENPLDIGSSIKAISRSSWARSSALSPNDQEKISELVAAHHQSEHAEVRAASIAALSTFPGVDFRQRIIAALKDPSEIVRTEAWTVYHNSPFPSSEVEELMAAQQDQQE